MIDFVAYSGESIAGKKQNVNEDYINFTELGDDAVLATVADGAGTGKALFHPAAIVSNEVASVIRRVYKKDKKALFLNMPLFLEMACLCANDALSAFKIGNEEAYGGFASTITGCLIHRSGEMAFCHAGNSRLYLIRDQKILQFTKDHTEGAELIKRGLLSQEQYYTSLERLTLRNGIGITSTPYIMVNRFFLRRSDIIALTSDGVHYSIRQEVIKDIILRSESVKEAGESIINLANGMSDAYSDNISACIIHYLGNGKEEMK